MRILLLICVIASALPFRISPSFQSSPTQDVIERCISTPVEPSDTWAFEGTIITFRYFDGVHGFRSDTPSRYYIAFDNDSEYGRFGSLSPNGQWFATFLGRRENAYSPMFNSNYFVTHIRVVSTQPDRETHVVPFQSQHYFQYARYVPAHWLNDTEFAAWSENPWGTTQENAGWYIIHPFEETSVHVSEMQARELDTRFGIAYGSGIPTYVAEDTSDDARAFVVSPLAVPARLYIQDGEVVYDTCIDVESWAVSPSGLQIAINLGEEHGFIYVIDVNDWLAYRLNLAANHLVAWVPDSES